MQHEKLGALDARRPQRHSIRFDMIDRDYVYLKQKATEQGWELNYLIRRICNRFVTLDQAGQDLGVFPAPLEGSDEAPRQRRKKGA